MKAQFHKGGDDMYAGAWCDWEEYKRNGLAIMFNIIEQKPKDYEYIRKQIYKNRYKRK